MLSVQYNTDFNKFSRRCCQIYYNVLTSNSASNVQGWTGICGLRATSQVCFRFTQPNFMSNRDEKSCNEMENFNFILPQRKRPASFETGLYKSWRWPTLARKDYHRPEELSFWVRNGIRRFLSSIVTRSSWIRPLGLMFSYKFKYQSAKCKINEVIIPKGWFHNFDFLVLIFDFTKICKCVYERGSSINDWYGQVIER